MNMRVIFHQRSTDSFPLSVQAVEENKHKTIIGEYLHISLTGSTGTSLPTCRRKDSVQPGIAGGARVILTISTSLPPAFFASFFFFFLNQGCPPDCSVGEELYQHNQFCKLLFRMSNTLYNRLRLVLCTNIHL